MEFKTCTNEVSASVYERKGHHLFEDRLAPGLTFTHFDTQTLDFCRRRAAVLNADHPWINMSDSEILDSCRLVKYDANGEVEGYSYAALLLFGTEDAFAQFLPGYKFELLYHKMTYSRFLENRPEDATRYDDRKTLRKNIIQSYREMMEFIDRYLPDKFYLPSN